MDDIHIGHIDDENYSFFGKLSDGTPVYKYNPPAPPDPNILKEQNKKKLKIIDDFNKSTEINYSDTSKFLKIFNEEQEKDKLKSEYIESVNENKVDSSIRKKTEDIHNVLDYIKSNSENEPVKEQVKNTNTTDYLDLFHIETEKEIIDQTKKDLIREQKLKHIEDEDKRRKESAQKYIDLLESIEDSERKELEKYELLIEQKEQELQDAYDGLLIEAPKVELYTEGAKFDVKVDITSKSVVVKNKNNKEKATFNYLGEFISHSIDGYKFRIYSIVKDDKEYGVIKESYNYVTHRHMAYDLRTLQLIKRDTFVVSKLDPTSVSKSDVDVYSDGTSLSNRSLSGLFEPFYRWDYPINTTLQIEQFTLDDPEISQGPVKITPTEIIVEARGAGGAGRPGLMSPGSRNGAGGGGGAYVRKTYSFNPYQQYPVNLRINVGDGSFVDGGGGQNDDTIFDNNYVRTSKDTYVVVENLSNFTGTSTSELSTIGGGGYDGDNAGSVSPGFPGKPMGSYDFGFYGAGFKPWSSWEFAVSAVTNETDWDNFLTGMQSNQGFGGNGALSGANAAGTADPSYANTLNIGTSGGRGARDGETPSLSGETPSGGGGAGFGNDAASLSGSPGGNGVLTIIISKGIIEY